MVNFITGLSHQIRRRQTLAAAAAFCAVPPVKITKRQNVVKLHTKLFLLPTSKAASRPARALCRERNSSEIKDDGEDFFFVSYGELKKGLD